MTEIQNINDLVNELIKIRDKYGNLPTIHNDISLEITGVSYRYLIIYSNYRTDQKKKKEKDGKETPI